MVRRLILLLACASAGSVRAQAPDPVDFNRDIRPILSDTCYPCHGPDKAKRKASLRLDVAQEGFVGRAGQPILTPGAPERSLLFQRITTAESQERMPPARAERQLTPAQVSLIRRWIEQGAKVEKHWSFLPVKRPALPTVKATDWPRNGIDYFILERLERAGLGPAPMADKTTLLRRLSFDLTGLPPTPLEVEAFHADEAPDAYERVVERLLQSPRYGERMASRWLDAARYADTSGYQSDGERSMWRWRDWVIDAWNRNMPFDQFTIEQLAGDLLPGATLSQKLATGFNRNHRGNAEGGIIPEEYAVEYVVDRVETTATVWLGLTLGCARCHDHKYDPIKQTEFYRVFAYFNNVPEKGRAIKIGNSPPYIKAPTAAQEKELAALDARVQAAEERLRALEKDILSGQAAWENQVRHGDRMDWTITDGLQAHFFGREPRKVSYPAGQPASTDSPGGEAVVLDGKTYLDAGDVAKFGFFERFTLSAWMKAADEHGGTLLSRMTDVEEGNGYAVELRQGRIQVNMTQRWLDDALRVATVEQLEPQRWYHVLVTYDGSRLASGVRVYLDGQPARTRTLLDELNQTFETKEPFRIGAGGGPERRFRGALADVRVYERALSTDEAQVVAMADTISALVQMPSAKRASGQVLKLRHCFLATGASADIQDAVTRLRTLRLERERFQESVPTCMVMEEMPQPRETFVLLRGEYDKRGTRVTAGVPACLPALPPGASHNRLAFARWLVDPAQPLTARVTVNRIWQMYFGTGLVKTTEDFGAQGEWPSHPELLDWLASEFVQSGWDVKALQRRIVNSATYRQSSRLTPELLYRDPENRLLARGPRQRLSAEMVRDQALAVSGLLVERLGGPSVKPYQPAGLWKELTGGADYEPDRGPGLYRRSLYTFWKRTIAPPGMMTFDAAGREACSVRETRTNTPLQALALLNDVTYVEAARVLAQRLMREGGTTTETRLDLAHRLVLGRRPTPEEARILLAGFQHHHAHFQQHRAAARRLLRTGAAPIEDGWNEAELAALTATASLLLNLDEAITRE